MNWAMRTARLRQVAVQVAARPDGSTPDQTETWGDLKAADRLFNRPEAKFQTLIEPHCRHTRTECPPQSVMLILNDATALDFSTRSKTQGLGPIGPGGRSWGCFLHAGLMINAASGRIAGLAGQEIFYRRARSKNKSAKNTRRRSAERESAVWGRLIERSGAPPPGVRWIHVCDRGADDDEVMSRALHQGCGFVIRAGRLNRQLRTLDGRELSVEQRLQELPAQGTREVCVPARPQQPARTAMVELRFAAVVLPRPDVLTPWLREHGPRELRAWLVELREVAPPAGAQPIRWVLYSTEPATTPHEAQTSIAAYERRPTIEDYHKCLKTGCRVEARQHHTAEALEAVTGLLSVSAVRLLQLKTAAVETPERPAAEVAPREWIALLSDLRRLPPEQELTIREFVRQLAGLGGFLLRKRDGEPGWITPWRGYENLQLLHRGASSARRRCG